MKTKEELAIIINAQLRSLRELETDLWSLYDTTSDNDDVFLDALGHTGKIREQYREVKKTLDIH